MSFNLSQEQQQAIDHLKGPSLIIAGAGTGKTTVLTEKIKRIVTKKKVKPENILALTFTEKAAFEMEERIDKALPYGYFQTWVMTFHGFADTLLREHGLHIGLSPSYKILSDAECILFLRNNLQEFKIKYFFSTGNPTGFLASVIKHFSRLRDENIAPKEYLKYAKNFSKKTDSASLQEAEKTLELANMYQKYQELKLKHTVLDYSDLIFYLVRLLRKRENILEALKKQFQYCLIDEFQDTNIVQYDMLKLLFPPGAKPNLTVIGDDNQSIYKFRGASISNILSFSSDYRSAKTFVLNTNYRSYQSILDSSYQLIAHNNPDTLEARLGISKKLVANRGDRQEAQPKMLHNFQGDEEGEQIAKKITSLAKSDDYQLNDFAILVRASNHAKPIIQALERFGLPFQFLGPTLLYYKNEIRDLIAVLRFMQNTQDSASLFRVLSMPIFNINRSELASLLAFSKRISVSLSEALIILKELYSGTSDSQLKSLGQHLPYFRPSTKNKFLKLQTLLENLLEKTTKQSALVILYAFLDKSGYLKKLAEIKTLGDEERLGNITKFFTRLKKITGQFGEPSVTEVIEHIDLSLELGDTPKVENDFHEKENAVNVLTAHSAKGLEFKVVFISNLVADRFPTRRRNESLPIPESLIKEQLPQGDYHLQEERRLFYVAMTRAKDYLFLTSADYYQGNKRQKKISPFVIEALGMETVDSCLQLMENQKRQLSIFEFKPVAKPVPLSLKPSDYKLDKFSYTQIQTYDRCPKQYEYRHLLRIPEPESAALSFGSSVHKALELFYKEIISGKVPTLKALIKHYQNSFAPLGYFSREMQERTYLHGQKLLTNYYQNFYDKNVETVLVEKKFTLKLNSDKKQYVVSGKIDRLDKHGKQYEIIDYKTGKKPAETVLRNSLQLGIYALAAMDKNLLNLPLEQITLTYFFLEKNERFSQCFTNKKLAKIKTKVLLSLEKMTKGNFQPNPGFHCEFCPYKIICPAQET